MNKKLVWIVSFLLILITIRITIRLLDNQCVESFDSFAYDGPRGRKETKALPRPPWQAVATIPPHQMEDFYDNYRRFDVVLTRSIEGQQEIWISGTLWEEGLQSKSLAIIYRPMSDGWEFVSTDIEDTGLYVDRLYVDSTGAIWGRTAWESHVAYPDLDSVPVVSKFNDTTRRFEFDDGVPEIPLEQSLNYYNHTHVVVDTQNIFWIFTETGEIFRYDTQTHELDKQAYVPSGDVINTALAPDGSIYFAERQITSPLELRMHEQPVFRFTPDTQTVEKVALNRSVENWPNYSGLLVDHEGTLWLGAIGYYDIKGEWHLMNRSYLKTYSDHMGQYLYAAPGIMLESSDGRLWFHKYLDSGYFAEGTAWYDPKSGTGCMFTNIPANIVEDVQQQLWLLADGTLYRHQLTQ